MDTLNRLKGFQKPAGSTPQAQQNLQQMEKAVHDNPNNFQAALNLAGAYLQVQQTSRALQVLDRVLNNPNADANALRALLQGYTSIGNAIGLKTCAAKLQALVSSNAANCDAALGLAEAYRDLAQP